MKTKPNCSLAMITQTQRHTLLLESYFFYNEISNNVTKKDSTRLRICNKSGKSGLRLHTPPEALH